MTTHPLLVWIHISDAKVVLLQQVEVVTDEVKQILTLSISLEDKKQEIRHFTSQYDIARFQRIETQEIMQEEEAVLS